MGHIFIGRKYALGLLEAEYLRYHPSLVVIYGRRRVGKSSLITHYYRDKNLWKFDGLEHQPKRLQIRHFLATLARYSGNAIYLSVLCPSWREAFAYLDEEIKKGKSRRRVTVAFDEFSSMAQGRSEIVSDLKWAWDSRWAEKAGFTLVLCGSVASFMIHSVVQSSALYGRVDLEIGLKPLSLAEVREFFQGRYAARELLDVYLFCGGIPAYLDQFDPRQSVAVNLNRLAFQRDGYFVQELDRLFRDLFRKEQVYRRLMMAFVEKKSLKAEDLARKLAMSKGSGFSRYLEHLEKAGFLVGYTPLDKPRDSRLKRYRLDDEYLHFYFKFIRPTRKRIEANTDGDLYAPLLLQPGYRAWAGLAFERACLKHVKPILVALNIDQLVKNYGAYFRRQDNCGEGLQIDLLLERHDPVVTLCEMKYVAGKVGTRIIEETERKVALLGPSKRTVEKVLITTGEPSRELLDSRYFSSILSHEVLFGAGG